MRINCTLIALVYLQLITCYYTLADEALINITEQPALNVLDKDLEACSLKNSSPGSEHTNKCESVTSDQGNHHICAQMTEDFMKYVTSLGIDMSLEIGDRWCFCVYMWSKAKKDGHAPLVIMEATNQEVKNDLQKLNLNINDLL